MAKKLTNKMLQAMHLKMVRIRRFEEEAGRLMEDGKIPGALHLYVGQEAVASGVMQHLADDDYITSTHRGHGHLIAKGGDFSKMFAELFGKATGYCKGKGGSMHISNMALECLARMALLEAVHPSLWARPSPIGFGEQSKYQSRFSEMGEQRRQLSRSRQYGRTLQTPVLVCLREQRVRRVHFSSESSGDCRRCRPRGGLRHAWCGGRWNGRSRRLRSGW